MVFAGVAFIRDRDCVNILFSGVALFEIGVEFIYGIGVKMYYGLLFDNESLNH